MDTPEKVTSLGHTPGERWAFDQSVTDCFSDMLDRSIPQHRIMRDLVDRVAARYIRHHTAVVDLGCSRGDAMAGLIDKFGCYVRWIGCEVSDPMLAAARERFNLLIKSGIVEIRKVDLRREYPAALASVTLCVLTLQFTPIEYRQQILKRIYDHTQPGGALILVEKLLGATADLDDLMVAEYYQFKGASGYSQDEIARKRMSLEGVLVPLSEPMNRALLQQAGFSQIDTFWRWMNFAGFVAVK